MSQAIAAARPAALDELCELIRRAKALVFDFDGTLIDSNPIKWEGFAVTFADEPERFEEIMAYCRGHHHVLRGEKFRHVYERILGRDYTPDAAARLQERFERATTQRIIAASEIPGAEAFVRLAPAHVTTALLSSSPHETLLAILRARGWDAWFATVQGAPVNKAQWLCGFAQARRLAAEEIVFFGDTAEDTASARAAGCRFVSVAGASIAGGYDGPAIDDFTALAHARLW